MPKALTTIELDIIVTDTNGDLHHLGTVKAEVPDSYCQWPVIGRMEFAPFQGMVQGMEVMVRPRVYPTKRGSLSVV